MGSLLSSPAPPPPRPPKNYILAFPEHDFPQEASRAPQDVASWYDDFFETLFCLPHKDGKGILIVEPPDDDDDDVPDSRVRPGWARKRLRGAYEILGGGCARVVRYRGRTSNNTGIIVEKLSPGPISWACFPALATPLPPHPLARHDALLLRLYYRWALQTLAALRFAHARGVFIRNFCCRLVWLRADFSAALTGFLAATAPLIEDECRRDGVAAARQRERERDAVERDELERRRCEEGFDPAPFTDGEWVIDGSVGGALYEGEESVYGGVKEDLYYWAVFVKFLVCNVFAGADAEEVHDGIEDGRMGSVIAKAENGGYENAAEVVEDVKAAAVKMGIEIVGDDEVDIGGKWEDVFEVCDRQLRFSDEE